jgi:hypothetical protein
MRLEFLNNLGIKRPESFERSFRRRIKEQKPILTEITQNDKKARFLELKALYEKQEQHKKEKHTNQTISEKIYEGTGIIESLRLLCDDLSYDWIESVTLGMETYYQPRCNSKGEIINYDKFKGYPYRSINYQGNTLTVTILDRPGTTDSISETLSISKNEQSFNLKFDKGGTKQGQEFHRSTSFELNTQNSDEIINGIARVAATYRKNK